jgi:hypothetical protein
MDMSTSPSHFEARHFAPATPVVLVVGEGGLRERLAVCLAAVHGEVIVARDFADKRLAATIGRSSLLVTDTDAAARHPAGVSGVAVDPRFSRAIVLAEHGVTPRRGDRLAFVARGEPPLSVAALAADWLAED